MPTGKFPTQFTKHNYQTLGFALPILTQYNNNKLLTSLNKSDTLDAVERTVYFNKQIGEKTNVNQYGTNEKEASCPSR